MVEWLQCTALPSRRLVCTGVSVGGHTAWFCTRTRPDGLLYAGVSRLAHPAAVSPSPPSMSRHPADVEVFYDGSTSATAQGYTGVLRWVDSNPYASA